MGATDRTDRAIRLLHSGLLACAIFGFPFVSTLPVFLGVDSRPISLVYRALVAGATLLVLVHAVFAQKPFIRGGHIILVLGVMCLLGARLVWDSLIAQLPLDVEWGEIWSFAIGVAFLPALAFLVRMDDQARELAFKWSLRLGVLAALSILAAAAVALSDVATFLRLDTGVLNPISIGHVGVSLFVLLILRPNSTGGLSSRRRVGWALVTVLGVLLAVALLVASGSKGPIVAWFVVLLGWLFSRGRASVLAGRGLLGVTAPLLLLLLVLSVLLLVNAVTPLPIIDRFLGIAQDQSTSERMRLLMQALAQFEESPLLGSSVFEYESRIYPHNVIVEALMVGGLVVLVPLLALLYENLRTAVRCLTQVCHDRWLALLFLQYFVDVMFSGSLFFSAQFWATSVAILGLASGGGGAADRTLRWQVQSPVSQSAAGRGSVATSG